MVHPEKLSPEVVAEFAYPPHPVNRPHKLVRGRLPRNLQVYPQIEIKAAVGYLKGLSSNPY